MGRGLKKDEFIVREGGLDAAMLSVNYIKSGGGGDLLQITRYFALTQKLGL